MYGTVVFHRRSSETFVRKEQTRKRLPEVGAKFVMARILEDILSLVRAVGWEALVQVAGGMMELWVSALFL